MHILKNGTLESQEELEQRLVRIHNLGISSLLSFSSDVESRSNKQLYLFSSIVGDDLSESRTQSDSDVYHSEILIEKAYQLQGDRIAYVENPRRKTDGRSEAKPHHCHRRLAAEYLQQRLDVDIKIHHL